MQLTRQTDYALRLLIFLTGSGGQRVQIAEVAQAQAISHAHLMKIANKLARAGFIEAVRGRGGGIRLAREPRDINLGAVVAVTEPECPMVDCAACRLSRLCDLPGILAEASKSFRAVLARYSLADIVGEPRMAMARTAQAGDLLAPVS